MGHNVKSDQLSGNQLISQSVNTSRIMPCSFIYQHIDLLPDPWFTDSRVPITHHTWIIGSEALIAKLMLSESSLVSFILRSRGSEATGATKNLVFGSGGTILMQNEILRSPAGALRMTCPVFILRNGVSEALLSLSLKGRGVGMRVPRSFVFPKDW